jgi:hypothetical protein
MTAPPRRVPGADQIDECALQRLAAAHLVGGAAHHDLALVDDRHVIADLLDQFHDMTGEQHRRAGRDKPCQQPADHVGRHRVNALQRLVQEQR